MNKKMLIESDPHETRIAILEQDRLTELFVERDQHRGIVGNIYKGRVNRVLPGMQAAFVDVGLMRDAFLYVNEVFDPFAEVEELDAESGDETEHREVARPSIDDLLTPGQELIVQVLKDAMPNKGARVSTQITLPGRYLVLLPNVPHLGISRRIEDEPERERLHLLLEELRPDGDGLIVRTAGVGSTREELESDLAYLLDLWRGIRELGARVAAPTLFHRDLDLTLRVVRDYLSDDFSILWVDSEETYERTVEFVGKMLPNLLDRVRFFQKDDNLFEHFDIEEEIEAALKNKVWLKSGGYIVIHQTEALVAIDVNTGRYVGRRNLEETVLTTNLEAVREIVRQIRLRNLGGIIVVDLIDMTELAHREQVFEVLSEELDKDRARNKVLSISEFGLVEITRKRSRPSLERLLTQPCPYCRGTGRINSTATVCLELRRQVLRQHRRFRDTDILLRLHPEVAQELQKDDLPILQELERELGCRVLLQSEPDLHQERFVVLEV